MSAVPIRWRPLGSRDLDASESRLTVAIAPWQAQWFSKPFLSVDAVGLVGPADEFALPATSSVWFRSPDVWLSAPAQAFPHLLNRALNLPRSLVLPETAAILIDDVKNQLVESLFAAINTAFSSGAQIFESVTGGTATAPLRIPYGAGRFRLVAADGETLLSIICGAETLWESSPLKASAGKMDSPGPTCRIAALGDSRMSIAASLGTCELTVPQLSTLAVGDVITLDCEVGDSIPVTFTGPDRARRTLLAMGKPGQTAGKLSIQLTSLASPNTP